MVSVWTRRWGVCAHKKGSVEEVCEWSVKVQSVAGVCELSVKVETAGECELGVKVGSVGRVCWWGVKVHGECDRSICVIGM